MAYPRVLVISNNSFSLSNSNGRTLGLLFKGWPKDRLSQFCITSDGPDWDVCTNYFCVSDKEVLKSTLSFRSVTRNDLSSYVTREVYEHRRIKRTPINSLIRHLIWRLGIWRKKAFNRWVDDFAPEVVVIQSGDTAFTHDLARGIAKQHNAHLVFFNTEGVFFLKKNYLYKGICDFVFFPLYNMIYRSSYKKAMNAASYSFYLNETIKADNEKVFNVPGCVIFTASYISPCSNTFFNKKNPIISYFGNFGFDRSKALIEFAKVLSEVNHSFRLTVYGRASVEDKLLFDNHPTIDYRGFISYEEVTDVIRKSDLIIHVESGNPLFAESLRYGFSTKIADCLSSGKPFILYCPKEIACAQYIISNKCAWFAETKEQLKEAIISIFNDDKKRAIISDNAIRIASINHNFASNSSLFQNKLKALCE